MVQVPILMMLSLFAYGIASCYRTGTKRNSGNEEQGASSFQVFFGYLIESLILGVIALSVGPPLGLFICGLLGSANGFMEFVQRTALPISLNIKAYLYSLGAVLISIITMLVPAYVSSRITIVEYREEDQAYE